MSGIRIDGRRLDAFRVIAGAGSITAAAQRLHLSQPAVTAQLRQLEEQVGAPLVLRGARGVTLTEQGRTLLEYAERAHRLLEEAETALSPSPQGGELVVASSTTTASYVLPRLLGSFLRRRAGVGVRVEVGNTEQVLAWVRAGSVPFGLVEGHARAAGLRLERHADDELVAVVSADAPRALTTIRKPADLERVPILWRESGSGTRAVVDRALRKAGARRGSRAGDLQLGSTEAIKAMVMMGAGVGFLSRVSVEGELAAGTLRVLPIRGVSIVRQFSWVLPTGGVSGVEQQFLAYARAEAPPRMAR